MSLDKNLTGEQIQQILDLFLYKALEPVVLNSNIFDSQVSYILSLITVNRKRKPSSLPRNKAIELLCQYLTTESRPEKFRLLREVRLQRSFLHVFLHRFLKEFESFNEDYSEYIMSKTSNRLLLKGNLDATAHAAGCDSRQGLYRIISISNDYLKRFYDYRSIVLDHYVKHSSRQAKSYTSLNGKNFDYLDVRQSILKNILLAIDKYDSSKGALTSYINWWILHAQTCGTAEHEYGIAYTIPQSQRKKIATQTSSYLNHSISLDDLSDDDGNNKSLHNVLGDEDDVERDYVREEQTRIVQYLAKCGDTRGVARLFLDIGEVFSPKELNTMREHTERDGLMRKV